MTDDAHLLRRYIEERSQGAFAELVERHLQLVYHAALRQMNGDVHAAKDVSQRVFFLLARKARLLASRSSLAGWLYSATCLEARAVRRAELRRRIRETAAQAMSDLNHDETPPEFWERLRPELDAALQELSELDREALLLRFFEGRRYAEIAAQLQWSEKTAHKRVERALERLRAQLKKRGLTSTSAALTLALSAQSAIASPSGLATVVTNAVFATGVVPAAGGLTTALHFMGTTKAIGTAAVVAVGIAGAIALNEARAARAARAELEVFQRETDALATRVGRAQAEASRTTESLASFKREVDAREKALREQTWKAREAEREAQLDQGRAFLFAHPEVREKLREFCLAQFKRSSRSVIAEHALTDEQVRQWFAIESRGTSGMIGAQPLHYRFRDLLDDSPPARSHEETQRELRRLLGDDAYESAQRRKPDWQDNQTVAWLAGEFSGTDTPLTAAQGETIARLIRENTPKNSESMTRPLQAWDAVMTYARQNLSASQIALLDFLKKQDDFYRAYWKSDRSAEQTP